MEYPDTTYHYDENFLAERDRIKNRVREIRKNRLMTQSQLADRASLARRTIHSVEKGASCRLDTKRKILMGLGLTFDDRDIVFPGATTPASESPV